MLLLQNLTIYLGQVFISSDQGDFVFNDVCGDGYCFYRALLQDVSLQHKFNHDFHCLRCHTVDCVTKELHQGNNFIKYILYTEDMSFDHWKERMLVTSVPLPREYWNRGIDMLLYLIF